MSDDKSKPDRSAGYTISHPELGEFEATPAPEHFHNLVISLSGRRKDPTPEKTLKEVEKGLEHLYQDIAGKAMQGGIDMSSMLETIENRRKRIREVREVVEGGLL